MEQSDREPALREYLLGGLSPAEREEIEEKLLTDADFHAEVQATGDDLIHVYLAGEMPPPDRERFESHFLSSPRRRERVAFVRSLVSAVDRVRLTAARPTGAHAVPPASRRSVSVLLPWAAALLVGLTAGGWSVHERRLRGREAAAAAQTKAELTRKLDESDTRVRELERQFAAASAPIDDTAIWTLPPGIERGTAPGDLHPAPVGRNYVRLRVALEEAPPVPYYRARLETAAGKLLQQVRGLQAKPGPRGPTLDVVVPAALLRRGGYLLSIQPDAGGEELTATAFVVE